MLRVYMSGPALQRCSVLMLLAAFNRCTASDDAALLMLPFALFSTQLMSVLLPAASLRALL
jgi:hypothetical protein